MWITNEFEAVRDSYGWTLRKWHEGLSKQGNIVRNYTCTHHGNFEQVLKRYIDLEIGKCESILDVREKLEQLHILINGITKFGEKNERDSSHKS